MDSGNEKDWQKCFIVFEGEEIIGCTTAIPIVLIREGIKRNFYLRGEYHHFTGEKREGSKQVVV